jgi:hypothetical protein
MGSYRERALGQGYVNGCVSVEGTDGFATGIPVCSESGELGFLARGFVSSPPCFELLIPALPVCCSANPDVGSPYSGVSMGVHDALLCFVRAAIFYGCGLFYQPLGI